ncbi:IclR family transcriptional regulator [Actinophytocola sp.]|uniref:IclR family transcriptional regulator n=1 Tax=Actinophytocola sp. TaxID=1872138 RepID=UPI003D6AE6C7
MSQAAVKALDLMDVVARAGAPGLSSTEAAAAAELDKTTASRLLAMLTQRGWLVRDPASRRYFPGRVLIEVAHATGFAERVPSTVHDVLRALQEQSGETVALHQLAGRVRLCVAGFESREEVRSALQAGETRPLDRGASSRVILAFCPERLRAQVMAEQADDAARTLLAEQLRWIVEHGYLSIESADVGGSGAIAVPLFHGPDIYGAIAIAGPASRFVRERRQAMVPALFRAGRDVSESLSKPPGRYVHWPVPG